MTDELKLLAEFASELAEHFDSVQIVVTKHDGATGETVMYQDGAGNAFARLGACQRWLDRQMSGDSDGPA